MSNFFAGLLFTLLGVSVYWNYHTSHQYEGTLRERDQTIQSLNGELSRLKAEVSRDQNTIQNEKGQQAKIVDGLKEKLRVEQSVLDAMTNDLNKAKNSASNQTEVERVSKELTQENDLIKELEQQIQNSERQLNSSNQQGHALTQEQIAARKVQDGELNLKIQTLAMQIKTEQKEAQELKRKRYDYQAQDRARSLESQIQTDKNTLQLFQDQKRQQDLEFSLDRSSTEEQIKHYRAVSQEAITALKSRRDGEKAKLPGLTRALADLRKNQDSRGQAIDHQNSHISDERKKVQALEQQLKDQQAILDRL